VFRQILTFPSRNLKYVLPFVIITGLIAGYFVNTEPLKRLLLPVIICAIYPSMIGFRLKDMTALHEKKILLCNLLFNLFVVPLAAYTTASVFLQQNPELFTGLIIISVVPGGTMIIAFTMIFKGNVKAAIKLTTLSLITGAFLAPIYLYVIVGKYVPVDIVNVFKNIALVVFLPMIMGMLTYRALLKRLTINEFNARIRPLLPGFSSWGLVYIIFTSISLKSQMIIAYPGLLLKGLTSLMLFYVLIYIIIILTARKLFSEEDGITFLLSLVLRNLAISIGLAATAFGHQATMMVALAFLIQQQAAVWFASLNRKYGILRTDKTTGNGL
jgi:ACR3 family arsenite efflux pump ArsB